MHVPSTARPNLSRLVCLFRTGSSTWGRPNLTPTCSLCPSNSTALPQKKKKLTIQRILKKQKSNDTAATKKKSIDTATHKIASPFCLSSLPTSDYRNLLDLVVATIRGSIARRPAPASTEEVRYAWEEVQKCSRGRVAGDTDGRYS